MLYLVSVLESDQHLAMMDRAAERDAKEQAKFHTWQTAEKATVKARFKIIMAIMVWTSEEERKCWET